MQFIRCGEYLCLSRITGPRHNLLQIRLGSGHQAPPVCERLPSIGTFQHDPLDEVELVAQVVEGIAEANRRLGSAYVITHLRYVENDTKPEVIYGLLAMKIAEHHAAGGEFIQSAA
jgi:hypothetical protein